MTYEYRDGWLWFTSHHHITKVGTRVGNKRPNGYWYYNNHLVHRLVWELHNGPVPTGLMVDHIDRDKDNCAIHNLRLVTATQSSANRRMPERSEPIGVRGYRGKFRAYIDGKHLGTYATVEAAHAARIAASSSYHVNSEGP